MFKELFFNVNAVVRRTGVSKSHEEIFSKEGGARTNFS